MVWWVSQKSQSWYVEELHFLGPEIICFHISRCYFCFKIKQRLREVGKLAQSHTVTITELKVEFKTAYAWFQSRAFNPITMYIIALPFPSYLRNYLFEFACLYIHLPWGLEPYLYFQQPAQNRWLALSSCSINICGTDVIKAFHDLPSLQAELGRVAPPSHSQCSHWPTFLLCYRTFYTTLQLSVHIVWSHPLDEDLF